MNRVNRLRERRVWKACAASSPCSCSSLASPAYGGTPPCRGQGGMPASSTAPRARTSTSCCTWRRYGATGATSWRAPPIATPTSRGAFSSKFIPVRVDQDADPGFVVPLRELGLAGHHHVRQGWQRDLQAPRLYPARAVRQAVGGSHRGSVGTASHHAATPAGPGDVVTRSRHAHARPGCCKATTRKTAASATSTASFMAIPLEWALERSRASQRNAEPRDLARCGGTDACRRAASDRSGVGRHVPVFRQARLDRAALREALEHPARRGSQLCAGVADPARSAPTSQRRGTSLAGCWTSCGRPRAPSTPARMPMPARRLQAMSSTRRSDAQRRAGPQPAIDRHPMRARTAGRSRASPRSTT